MKDEVRVPSARDKTLFTPGPLTTSLPVKLGMLRDLGSRDVEFIESVRQVRDGLLRLGGVSKEAGFETVLMQGSGTFGVESVIGSTLPRDGKLLVVINGAYGERIAKIAEVLRIDTTVLRCSESSKPDVAKVRETLETDDGITHVAIVHCETTTGIINPVEEVGREVHASGRTYIVDAMSSFGALPIDIETAAVDFLVSSANKCIEGVPGFSFAICRRDALEACKGRARSLSLDLHAQWAGLESNGQFRFTPPTHTILAFAQALREIEAEGGVAGRAARYRRNYETLVDGMRAIGFEEYLPREDQGHIITSFRYPQHERFDFGELYQRLSDTGLVIYPGKVSDADCFRIGNIGRIFESDVEALLGGVRQALDEMGVKL